MHILRSISFKRQAQVFRWSKGLSCLGFVPKKARCKFKGGHNACLCQDMLSRWEFMASAGFQEVKGFVLVETCARKPSTDVWRVITFFLIKKAPSWRSMSLAQGLEKSKWVSQFAFAPKRGKTSPTQVYLWSTTVSQVRFAPREGIALTCHFFVFQGPYAIVMKVMRFGLSQS